VAEITIRAVESKQEWESFMTTHPEANFLHSWQWGVFNERLGRRVERIGLYKNDQLKGVIMAVLVDARRGRHIVEAGGPILDWQDAAVVQAWVTALRNIAKKHRCSFVRVRPQLVESEQSIKLFKGLGFNPAPMHVTADLTHQLLLPKTDEELKKAMRKGTRYEVNRAQKLGIKVERVEDEQHVEEFIDLQMQTAQRQKFVPFTAPFLREQFKAFLEDNNVTLYRSSHEGRLLAYAFIIFYGQEAAYHYGASTELARTIPGAYAIQWQAIHDASTRGCARYNFWGVAEHGRTNHRFYGVSVFKRGFGGEDVAYLHAKDLICNPVKYAPTYVFETIRRRRRKL